MHIKSQQLEKKSRFSGFDSIFEPLSDALDSLNLFLDSQIGFFEPELQDLVRYTLMHKGKRLRPMLVFYSAWNEKGAFSKDLIKVAGIIELIHLATLVHDDILDDATIRHNMPTVFKKYGSKIAILLGDALFSHALVLASEFQSGNVCHIISQSIKKVCAGEIKQTFQSSKDTHSVEDYFRIIDLKTAELFYVSCLLGARLAGGSDGYVDAVATFGRNIGIAYQIYDDLIDILDHEKNVGKTLGTDFASGKHTLPTLKLMDSLTPELRLEFLQGLKTGQIQLENLRSMLIEQGVFFDIFNVLNQKIENAGRSIADFKYLHSFSHLIKIQDLILSQVQRLQALNFG